MHRLIGAIRAQSPRNKVLLVAAVLVVYLGAALLGLYLTKGILRPDPFTGADGRALEQRLRQEIEARCHPSL